MNPASRSPDGPRLNLFEGGRGGRTRQTRKRLKRLGNTRSLHRGLLLHAMCYALIVAPLLALSLQLNDAPAMASGGAGGGGGGGDGDPPAASQSDIDAYTDSLQAIHDAMFGPNAGPAPVNWEVINDPAGVTLDLRSVEGSFSTTLHVDETLADVPPEDFDLPADASDVAIENARLINATAFPGVPLAPVSVTAWMYTVADTTTGETLTLLNFFGFTDDIFPPEVIETIDDFNRDRVNLCPVGPNGQTSCSCQCRAALSQCLQWAIDDLIACLILPGIGMMVAAIALIAGCMLSGGTLCIPAGLAGSSLVLGAGAAHCLWDLATDISRCHAAYQSCLQACPAGGTPISPPTSP